MGGGKEVHIQVDNVLNAQKGDVVRISVSDSAFLKATFLVYLVPVMGLLLGAVLGQDLAQRYGADPDIWAALWGFGFLGVFFAVVRIFANRLGLKPNYRPLMTKILPKRDDEEKKKIA